MLLESQVLGTSAIIPVFHEASYKHADHVLLKDFFDIFAISVSKKDLTRTLEHAIGGEQLTRVAPERLSALCRCYLGNDDGRSSMRAVAVLRSLSRGAVRGCLQRSILS